MLTAVRPRLEDYSELNNLVAHLRNEGLETTNIVRRLMQIGPVDLDMLDQVLQQS